MLFPPSDRQIYHINPLGNVICQLRFPSILSIGAGEPAPFQDLIRKEYPLYRREDGEMSIIPKDVPKEISAIFSQLPFPKLPEATIHKFYTEDESKFISIKSDFFAFTDYDYKHWDDFRARMISAKGYFESLYEPAFYTRVGLRYQNIIDKKRLGLDNEPWDGLLNKSILGFLGTKNVKDAIKEFKNNTLFRIDNVEDGFVRVIHGLVDLDDGLQVYRIDADFFVSERRKGEDVTGILEEFNKMAGYLFRWAATDKLKAALNPE